MLHAFLPPMVAGYTLGHTYLLPDGLHMKYITTVCMYVHTCTCIVNACNVHVYSLFPWPLPLFIILLHGFKGSIEIWEWSLSLSMFGGTCNCNFVVVRVVFIEGVVAMCNQVHIICVIKRNDG